MNLIIKAMSYGFFFRARDEEGNLFPSDRIFLQSLSEKFETTLTGMLYFNPVYDRKIIIELKKLYLLNHPV